MDFSLLILPQNSRLRSKNSTLNRLKDSQQNCSRSSLIFFFRFCWKLYLNPYFLQFHQAVHLKCVDFRFNSLLTKKNKFSLVHFFLHLISIFVAEFSIICTFFSRCWVFKYVICIDVCICAPISDDIVRTLLWFVIDLIEIFSSALACKYGFNDRTHRDYFGEKLNTSLLCTWHDVDFKLNKCIWLCGRHEMRFCCKYFIRKWKYLTFGFKKGLITAWLDSLI